MHERAFSSAGITISKRRNRLGPDIVEALQFLKCWFRRDLIFREEPTVANERKHETEGNSGTGSKDNKESGWDLKLLDDEEDDMDIEPDGDDDDDVYLFDIS
ncbi:hypothetical protein H0H81_003487 [Sphagnurus paluster]|uniref:HAT C-terminal dimerisation domain-containing protein n=1 Tax=Sphagnurus paluster TaxID=117069 RepID=A0A9P7GM64_9AGAR|nr:hypothetical protein H0H81_003487 [Sphagnurus paluster]